MSEPFQAESGTSDDPLLPLLAALHQRFGSRVDAIFLYGSWRRGQRDTMPDLYVLLDRYPEERMWLGGRLLPPTVLVVAGGALRAKVTVLLTSQLEHAVTHDFHPYFWARFAQPAPVLFVRDAVIRQRCITLADRASTRLTRLAATWWQGTIDPDPATFWRTTFVLTYGAELRSESPERIAALYPADQSHYDHLYIRWFRNAPKEPLGRLFWRMRQLTGKCFSAVRILKAVFTFEDPLDYLAWKVGRQSGVKLEASALAKRWPLLFGWAFVWRLYRAGGFR